MDDIITTNTYSLPLSTVAKISDLAARLGRKKSHLIVDAINILYDLCENEAYIRGLVTAAEVLAPAQED